MQVHTCRVGNRVEELSRCLHVHLAQTVYRRVDIVNEVRTAGKVDGALHKGLIHRQQEEAVAGDARLVAERLADCLADHDTHVLHGVMRIHIEIALRLQRKIEEPVLGKSRQHVVKESDSGGNVKDTRSVNVQFRDNRGLLGVAHNFGLAFCFHTAPPPINFCPIVPRFRPAVKYKSTSGRVRGQNSFIVRLQSVPGWSWHVP